MIKPILYHSFEEKAILEKEMMAKIPREQREIISNAIMEFFHKPCRIEEPSSRSKRNQLKENA